MRYFTGSMAMVAILTMTPLVAAEPPQRSSEQKEVDAEVVMKDKAFHITQGESGKDILLVSGIRADIRLKNEDSVAHTFVSTMLYNRTFQINGNGTFVKAPNAAGIRVDPGQTVVLTFEVPSDYKEFQHLYEVFWCNVHGRNHGDTMRGEILIVDQRGETGGA
jgi:hypothetical protein